LDFDCKLSFDQLASNGLATDITPITGNY